MMMRALLLLLAASAASAFLQKPAAAAIKPTSDEVPKLTKKLEQVVGGLEKIASAQQKSPTGPSKFGEILKPFLSQMHQVLKEVETDKKLTEAQKLQKLHDAQASVTGLQKDMAKLSSSIKAEGDEDQQSILLGVLMSRKDRPEAEQMEILHSDDFKNLEVVKYVLAHKDAKKSLAEQVAARLDATSKPSNAQKHASTSGPPLALQAMTQGIATQLEGFLKTMEKHLADQEKYHKKVLKDEADALKTAQAKMTELKGKDKNLKDKKMNLQKQKTSQLVKILKRRQKKEDRQYGKEHALLARDVSALKQSIDAVKKGDIAELGKAQKILQDSMKAMQGSQDFLHFLQVASWTEEKSCPYCKAQCLEKCHNEGKTFMACMQECDSVGN